MDWLLLQIADSAFPTGGFAHSGGLEAAFQYGEVKNADGYLCFLQSFLWQLGFGALPFANEAHALPAQLTIFDQRNDLFLNNPVANRASKVQGRTFLSACEKIFFNNGRNLLAIRERNTQHHAPIFGVVLAELGASKTEMQKIFFHSALRSSISAAVRLGIVGPYQAQELQWRLRKDLDAVLKHCANFSCENLAQTNPLLDMYQGNHERLYSRLFQS